MQVFLLFLFLSENTLVIVFLAHGCSELAEQFLLICIEALGNDNADGNELVASALSTEEGYALALESEQASGLRTLGNGELHLAVKSRHFDFRAQCRLSIGYILFHHYGGTLTLEYCMRLNNYGYTEVAAGTAIQTRITAAAL